VFGVLEVWVAPFYTPFVVIVEREAEAAAADHAQTQQTQQTQQ
jgi:hypothetical protein